MGSVQNKRTTSLVIAAILCALSTAVPAQDRPSFNDLLRYAQATSRTSYTNLTAHATPYVNRLAPKFKSYLNLLKDNNEQLKLVLTQVEVAVRRAEAAPQDAKLRAAATQAFEKPLRLLQGVGQPKELPQWVASYRQDIEKDRGKISLEQASLNYWIRFHSGKTEVDVFGRPERDPANPWDEMPHPQQPSQIPGLQQHLAELDSLPSLSVKAIAAAALFQNCVDVVSHHQSALEQSLADARDHIPDYAVAKERLAGAVRSQMALNEATSLCNSPTMWGG